MPDGQAPDQFQYVKLPDGSYGKFAANATDDQIRTQITKDFPDAYKEEDPFRVQGATDPNAIPMRTTMRRSPSYPARVLDAGITGQFPYVHPIDAYAAAVSPLEEIKATLPGTGVSFGEAAKRSIDLANIVGTEEQLLGLPEIGAPERIGEGITTPVRSVGDFAAKTLRKPATPMQAQMGEAGTIRGGFLRNTPLSDLLVPKGSPGTYTNPGPYMRIPLRVKPPDAASSEAVEETPAFTPFKPSSKVVSQIKGYGSYDPLKESRSYEALPKVGAAEGIPGESTLIGATGSAISPFEPLIWESPEEAAARDFRMKNLERQAKSSGMYHAAQGSTSKRLNLQQRIGKKMN